MLDYTEIWLLSAVSVNIKVDKHWQIKHSAFIKNVALFQEFSYIWPKRCVGYHTVEKQTWAVCLSSLDVYFLISKSIYSTCRKQAIEYALYNYPGVRKEKHEEPIPSCNSYTCRRIENNVFDSIFQASVRPADCLSSNLQNSHHNALHITTSAEKLGRNPIIIT